MTFADGSTRALLVAESLWRSSIHGSALLCTDCHQNIDSAKHPGNSPRFASDREYVVDKSESCKRCHYAYYTRALDSIHFTLRESGKDATPTCADCHPAHSMKNPRSPQAISARCGSCHADVYRVYRESVHGKALLDTGNRDVPTCIDCHSAHSIADPKTTKFHASIPDLCAKCHSDEKKMKKYGLTTSVYTTYVGDFHGKSNQLYNKSTVPSPKLVASCTDCHGVHDIGSFRSTAGTEGPEKVRERLVISCRKCHEGVPLSFADAWLSHYPPKVDAAPLLWGVKKFYAGFNPFMIGLFVCTVLLDFWRVGARSLTNSQNQTTNRGDQTK